MTKEIDVISVCNALVDIILDVEEKDIETLGLNKGVMHLVESEKQDELLTHFHGHEKAIELGGSAMNAIRALAGLGLKTSFAGMIAEDEFGGRIRARMDSLGINSHLGVTDVPTGSCVILVTPDGERTMNTHLGASRLYDEEHIPFDEIERSKIFHFCGYQWDTDGQKTAIMKALDAAKEAGCKISFDVADPFVVNLHRDEFRRIIENYADIVFANEEEAKILYETSPEETAEKIAQTGAIAVVKLGAKGAIVQSGDQIVEVKPVKTTVVDTTAAGDMFAAGFLYGIASGHSLAAAGSHAAALASDVISRYGATLSDDVLKDVARNRF